MPNMKKVIKAIDVMDREKVISNLQVVHNYLKSFENTAKMGEWVADALSLLKWQEPAEPIRDAYKNRRCPRCNTVLKGKFCLECGKAVKWE